MTAALADVLAALADGVPFHPDAPCVQEAGRADELWMAQERAGREAAAVLCIPCPIREACREAAVARGEVWGVWGGMIREGAKAPAKPRARKATGPSCGTPQGYRTHRERKEDACKPCVDAWRDYGRTMARKVRKPRQAARRAAREQARADTVRRMRSA